MSKKGENIYKRKDNRWEARFVKSRSNDGKIKYGYCYGKTYHEVKEKLQEARLDMLTKVVPVNNKNKTFSIYIDEWLTVSRIIPLPDSILHYCKECLSDNPEDFVLTGRQDKYMEPRTLQNRLKKYSEECGISDLHFHMLRHTFATRCVEVGFEIKSLSEILGHSTPKITLERYVHSSLDLKRDNMNKLSAIGF